MDANDYAFIESRLNAVLPTAFKDFMAAFPNDRQHQLQNEHDVLPSNGELFAIDQLQRFFNGIGFDYYKSQPKLRSRRYIQIGGDGCGNHYCMVGDDANSDELWMWEHDPANGFSRCVDRSLTEYFGQNWKVASQPDPFASLRGTFLTRTDHPLRSVFEPISLAEWMAYVKENAFLTLEENHESKNPFTSKNVKVRRWPGRAKLTEGNASCHLSYAHGALELSDRPSADLKTTVERMARDLNALVWSDFPQ